MLSAILVGAILCLPQLRIRERLDPPNGKGVILGPQKNASFEGLAQSYKKKQRKNKKRGLVGLSNDGPSPRG